MFIYQGHWKRNEPAARGLGTEISTCMSEVLALAVEAVSLRHKAMTGCLVKFPELCCEPVPHVLLDVIIQGELFAPQSIFLGDQKWHNRRERGLDCMEGDREPPTWIYARVPWLCWPYEALYCHGAEWHPRVSLLVISIWSLGEGWPRFASNTGHSLLSHAAGSLSEGGHLDERRTSV